MRVAGVAILPTSQISPRSVGYSYTSPTAFVPPASPVHTVGTPSSPNFPTSWGVPRATPQPIISGGPLRFLGSGGSLGTPIAKPVAPIARVTTGLFR